MLWYILCLYVLCLLCSWKLFSDSASPLHDDVTPMFHREHGQDRGSLFTRLPFSLHGCCHLMAFIFSVFHEGYICEQLMFVPLRNFPTSADLSFHSHLGSILNNPLLPQTTWLIDTLNQEKLRLKSIVAGADNAQLKKGTNCFLEATYVQQPDIPCWGSGMLRGALGVWPLPNTEITESHFPCLSN